MGLTRTIVVCAAMGLILAGQVAIAGTTTYKGTGTFTATRMLLPLASGDAAVQITNSVVATIEPSDSGFIYGECAGLGMLTASGKYTASNYCTFQESDKDGFVIKGDITLKGGSVKIIGGSGKWEGATGTGTVTPRKLEGDRGTYDYEFKIIMK